MNNPFISKRYKVLIQYLVTPELAAYILEHWNNDNPRDLDWQEAKKRLARSITRGEFQSATGLNAAFLKDGTMGDGQTRFAAIVESGIAVKMDIVCGLTREAIALRDCHRTRSVAVSWAWVLGCGRAAISTLRQAVAVTRVWMRFECKWLDMRFTRKEMLDFYLTHAEAIKPVLERRENKNARRAGFRAACAFYSTINRRKAAQLFNDVTGDGENLSAESPAKVLRDYLDSTAHSQQHPEKQLVTDFGTTLAMCHHLENNVRRVECVMQMLAWQ